MEPTETNESETEFMKIKEQLIQDVEKLRHAIAEAAVPEEQNWFRNLLVALLNCILEDYSLVALGTKRSVPLAAWARRNLLEVKVITEFVLKSEANARSFQTDMSIDAKELYEAISKSHASTHKRYIAELSSYTSQLDGQVQKVFETELKVQSEKGPNTAETDSEAQGFKEYLSEIGVKEKLKPKTSSEIANQLEQAQKDDFGPMFKICSKLMHRTALSIASTNQAGSLDAMIPFLDASAFTDLAVISGRIKQYVDTEGIRAPAPE
jgi:hypothetical protein